ncbi:MAG: hypothetical protein ACRYGI_02550 [Janthinobacterium lividum]
MRGSWGIWIGGTLVALNALVFGQDLVAYHHAAPGSATAGFPLWPLVTLIVTVGYTAVATTMFVRDRRTKR